MAGFSHARNGWLKMSFRTPSQNTWACTTPKKWLSVAIPWGPVCVPSSAFCSMISGSLQNPRNGTQMTCLFIVMARRQLFRSILSSARSAMGTSLPSTMATTWFRIFHLDRSETFARSSWSHQNMLAARFSIISTKILPSLRRQ